MSAQAPLAGVLQPPPIRDSPRIVSHADISLLNALNATSLPRRWGGDGIALAGLEPGTLQILEPGEDIKFSDPADVGGSYSEFLRTQFRAVAAAIGITYEQLTGDLTGVNYSSIRAGLLEFRRRCEMVAFALQGEGVEALAFAHEKMKPKERHAALEPFTAARARVLVTTDAALRGLELRRVHHVVGFDMPPTMEAYADRMQCVGCAGHTGVLTTMVTDQVRRDALAELAATHAQRVVRVLDELPAPRDERAEVVRGGGDQVEAQPA